MKKLLIILALLLVTPVYSQDKVEIDQETAQQCSKCFDEVKAWREAVTKLEVSSAKDKEVIEGLKRIISFYEKTNTSQNAEILALRASIRELMEYVIKRPTTKCNGFLVFSC